LKFKILHREGYELTIQRTNVLFISYLRHSYEDDTIYTCPSEL